MKLLRKIVLLTTFSALLTTGIKLANNEVENGKAYVAITYYMAENGYSNGETAFVGALGVGQGAAYSWLATAIAGGPVGWAVGIGFGL
ncbi:MAG: hypothetical protein L3J25_00065 [Flavobacteriaceae bacterium]|nr:hypothetical protein [Flavobacteriaceae bacterium]